jgi:hypothetical protein
MSRVGVAVLVLVLASGAGIASAHAQAENDGAAAAGDEPRDRARALFERASAARAAGDWEEACRLLEESLVAYPQFSTAWNLVTAYERNDDLVRAERVLERIRDGEVGEVSAEERSGVLERLSVIGAELSTIVILGPEEPEATLEIDREDVGALDPRGRARVRVVPGTHVITLATRDGRRTEASVSAERGETRRVRLALAALAPVGGSGRDPAPPVEDDGGSVFESPWLWIAVGALLVAGGVTATVLLVDGPTRDPVTADFQIPAI